MSISEREESYCGEDIEPDGAECTTNSPNSVADSVEVHRINTRFMGLFADNVVELILITLFLNFHFHENQIFALVHMSRQYA